VPDDDVDLVDLQLARQLHCRCFSDQAAALLLRHGLHVRPAKAQLLGDLLVGKVQAHEVEAQHPHTQRLMVSGQHHRAAIPWWEMPRSGIKAGEIVEAGRTCLAPIPLPGRLRVVVPVPNHRRAAAPGATHTLWPAVLAHEGEALGVVHEAGKVDQVRCRHDGESSSRELVDRSHALAITPDAR